MSSALTESKVQSDVFPDFDSAVNFYSAYPNWDTKSEYKIHYDHRVNLCGNPSSSIPGT
jgi:cytochrome c